jgi:phenylacetate-CoA ligase
VSVAAEGSVSGSYGLRLLAHAYGWRRYRAIASGDWLSPDRIAALQSRKLLRLLRHACATVPHYRDIAAGEGLRIEGRSPFKVLAEFPVLTKADVAASFPDRILSRGRRSLASKHRTSTGTTSDRVDVILDLSSQQWRHAHELWADGLGGGCRLGARRLEIPPDACSRECGINSHRPERFWDEVRWAAGQSGRPVREAFSVLGQRTRGAVRHRLMNDRTLPPFGPEGTCIPPEALQSYVDAIREDAPYLLTGLPTYLHQIARHLQRTGQTVHVPVVRPMGSLSTPAMKRLIAESFGGEVYETYGSNELGGIACECSAHQWLHVSMGAYVVEVLRDGRPAGEGELGHLVVTCLNNYAMPLIRYQLGDVGRWHQGPCACGRATQLIECNGRIQDLVVTAAGKTITEEEFLDFFYFRLGLEHFQLVERKRGQFDLMVVAGPSQSLDVEAVRAATGDLLDAPERVDVFPTRTIYPEATGKFRFVKSASYGDLR